MKNKLNNTYNEIVKILKENSSIRDEKISKMIPECNHYMNIIFLNKGGICVYCRTMFKVLSSLIEHQEKSCYKSK